jgi:hypothetical protein
MLHFECLVVDAGMMFVEMFVVWWSQRIDQQKRKMQTAYDINLSQQYMYIVRNVVLLNYRKHKERMCCKKVLWYYYDVHAGPICEHSPTWAKSGFQQPCWNLHPGRLTIWTDSQCEDSGCDAVTGSRFGHILHFDMLFFGEFLEWQNLNRNM